MLSIDEIYTLVRRTNSFLELGADKLHCAQQYKLAGQHDEAAIWRKNGELKMREAMKCIVMIYYKS